ncbi:MAG: hypothetical protein AB2A00_16070 [Myxococcota bacterium]
MTAPIEVVAHECEPRPGRPGIVLMDLPFVLPANGTLLLDPSAAYEGFHLAARSPTGTPPVELVEVASDVTAPSFARTFVVSGAQPGVTYEIVTTPNNDAGPVYDDVVAAIQFSSESDHAAPPRPQLTLFPPTDRGPDTPRCKTLTLGLDLEIPAEVDEVRSYFDLLARTGDGEVPTQLDPARDAVAFRWRALRGEHQVTVGVGGRGKEWLAIQTRLVDVAGNASAWGEIATMRLSSLEDEGGCLPTPWCVCRLARPGWSVPATIALLPMFFAIRRRGRAR